MPQSPLRQFVEQLNSTDKFPYKSFYKENIINVVVADDDDTESKKAELVDMLNDMEPPMQINHIVLCKQTDYDKK